MVCNAPRSEACAVSVDCVRLIARVKCVRSDNGPIGSIRKRLWDVCGGDFAPAIRTCGSHP